MVWFLTIWLVLSGAGMVYGLYMLGKPKSPRMYIVHHLIGLTFGSSGWAIGTYLNRDNPAFYFFLVVGGAAVGYQIWMVCQAIWMAREQEKMKHD